MTFIINAHYQKKQATLQHFKRRDGVWSLTAVVFNVMVLAASLFNANVYAEVGVDVLPTGGHVAAGAAQINQYGTTMNVNQSSDRAVINWNSFDVGANATVNFNQPNANSSTLNRVTGATPSMIHGAINANGHVVFVNPNGVVFGAGAQVNAGAITATTMNITDADFMAGGKQTFSGNGTGKVENHGRLTVNSLDGYIALMAPEVRNEGVLVANMSGANAIALVAGQKVTLSFSNNALVTVSVDASAINALIENKRLIKTNGGQIIVAANSASDLKMSVINNTGVMTASGFDTSGGKITLTASIIRQHGHLEASAIQSSNTSTASNLKGGQITLVGEQITLGANSKTVATGVHGGGQILIGTEFVKNNTNTQLNNKLASNVNVESNALIDVSATQSGHGGMIQIWSINTTSIAGLLKATGGVISGSGGLIETNAFGQVKFETGLNINASAYHGDTVNGITNLANAGYWLVNAQAMVVNANNAAFISQALNNNNVTLNAIACFAGSACQQSGGVFEGGASINLMAGANVLSHHQSTVLNLIAENGDVYIRNVIDVANLYAMANALIIEGVINSNAGAHGNIVLAGTTINLLGSLGANGNTGSNSSGAAGSSSHTGSTSTRRRDGSNSALEAETNVYATNAGHVQLIAIGDIYIGHLGVVSANGVNGGNITIASTTGQINIEGIVDALGTQSQGGFIGVAGHALTDMKGAFMSVEGLSQGGMLNLGVMNNLSNGSILAPPATAPPANLASVMSSFLTATLASDIISSQINIGAQSNFSAANGQVVIFGQHIFIDSSTITAIKGVIIVGREAYAAGGLSDYTNVTNNTLVANKVETSAALLGIDNNTVRANEWLLDPTDVDITTAASTGGSLTSALAFAGVSVINTVNLINAINAGTSVNIVVSGNIRQSNALTFTNNSNTDATLTLDNTLGARRNITLVGGITATAGSSRVSVVAKSAGGLIASNGIINVNGDVTFDNTFAVNGSTSGFITEQNALAFASLSSTQQAGIKNTNSITARNITMIGAHAVHNQQAIWVDQRLTATHDIKLFGFLQVSSVGVNKGVYINRPMTITSHGGHVEVIGKVLLNLTNTSTSGGNYSGVHFINTAAASQININANKISISGYTLNTQQDTDPGGSGVNITGASLNIHATANYSAGGDAVSIYGFSNPNSTIARSITLLTTSNTFTTNPSFGSINQDASGGSVRLSGNASIRTAFSSINIAANNTGLDSQVIYDTTAGGALARINNQGRITTLTGLRPINLIQQSNGGQIANGTGVINVSGHIKIDNTNGSITTPSVLNSSGVSITGSMTAGTLAGNTGITINAIASGTGVGINSTAALNALAGPVSLTATTAIGSAINLTSTALVTSTAGISIIGSSTLASALIDTQGAVSVLGAISNTGVGGVLIQSTANTVTGNVSDSGVGNIRITGGFNIAPGTVTGGTITAVGTLNNTGGGVISLSMAQATSATGGAIETAAGVTSANASVLNNVSYSNVGGVMGATNVSTVNSVNYRTILSGNTTINIQVENYSQEYGTAYNGSIANSWLANVNNVNITSILGSSSGFGVVSFTNNDALSSLRFAPNLGVSGNSNFVQSNSDLSVLGAITSSYGTVNVTARSGKNTYTITPKALTISGSVLSTAYNGVRSYAEASFAGFTLSGLVSSIGGVATGDAVTSLSISVASSNAPSTPLTGVAQVGTYIDTLSNALGSGLSNYTISYAPGLFSVSPAVLQIIGGNRSTIYNAAVQTNANFTVNGLLGLDTVTSVLGLASGTNVNSYADVLSGAIGSGLSNYTITYTNGALTITRAPLIINSVTTNAMYTGVAQTGSFTVTGLLGSIDNVTGINGAATGTNVGDYVSGLSGASGVGLDNYNITYTNTGTFSITKANATITGTVNTQVFNGQLQTNTGASFIGLLANDANTITATGFAQVTNVVQGIVADNLSGAGANAVNYNFTVNNGSLRITPKTLNVVGGQTTVVYNATTHTNISTQSGLETGDAITVSGSVSARNVSTTNDTLSVAFTSGLASNYAINITNGFLKITPATLNFSGITAADKTYNGTTAAVLTGTPSISGMLGSDNVSISVGSLSGVFADRNAGDGKTVLISGIVLSGADAANYQLSGGATAITTAKITPAPLIVTGLDLTTTYNALNQALAAPTTTGLIAGDNVIVIGGANGITAGTTTATYTISGTDIGNYVLSANAPVLTINKAELRVTADNNAKFVTQADPTLTAQVSGFQGSDTAANLNFTFTVTRAPGETVAGGASAQPAYDITPAGNNSLTNYNVSYVDGAFTIAPAGAVLIKMNPTLSTYGTVVAGTIASVQYVTDDGNSVLRTLTLKVGTTNIYTDGILGGGEITITPTTTITATTGVGSYVGAISNTNNNTATSNGNFSAVQTIVNTAIVNQANLTITLNPVIKTYDGSPFTGAGVTPSATGLMNNESLGAITYSGAAIGAINASGAPYSLLGSVGSSFANYNVTIAPTTLTINKAPLQITGGTNTFTFNNTLRTNTFAISAGQLFGSDAVTNLTGLSTRLHAGVTPDNLSAATGAGLSNYNISYINGGLTINPAQIFALATPTNAPVYNGTTAVPNTTLLTGVIAGTSVSGTTNLALSGDDVGLQNLINHGTTLTGANAGDYIVVSSNLVNTSLNQVTPIIVQTGNGGGTVIITPAPLTITGGTASFVFDNTTRTNTFSITNGTLYAGDTVTNVSGRATGLRASNTPYADTLSAATGLGLTNYAITYVNGGITITRAPLTALATPDAMTYDGLTNIINTTVLSGVILGTNVSGVTSLTLGSPNAGSQVIVNNGTVLSGDHFSDYYVVSSNVVGNGANQVTSSNVATGNGGGNIEVARAPLSIIGGTSVFDYNATLQSNIYEVSGLVNNEVITATGIASATNVSQGEVNDVLVAVAGSGTLLSNYAISIINGSISITPAVITIGGISAQEKVYDGTNLALLNVGTVSFNGVFASDIGNVSVNTSALTGAFSDEHAEINKTVSISGISIDGTASSNYRLSGGTTATTLATIIPASLTFTGSNNVRMFNGTTQTNSGATLTAGTIISGESLTIGGYAQQRNVLVTATPDQLFAIAGDNTLLSNYNITFINGSLRITPAPLTATVTANAMTYNGSNSISATTALSGFIGGATGVSGATSLTAAFPDAGVQTIINGGTVLSGVEAANYSVTNTVLASTSGANANGVAAVNALPNGSGYTINIARAPLTFTGANNTLMFNGAMQTNSGATLTSGQFVAGQNVSIGGYATATFVADMAMDNLIVTANSGTNLNNYAITFVNGSLTINPALLIQNIPAEKVAAINPPEQLLMNRIVNDGGLVAIPVTQVALANVALNPMLIKTEVAGLTILISHQTAVGQVFELLKVVSSNNLVYEVPSVLFNNVNTQTEKLFSYAATLEDGNALPAWLKFDDGVKTFSAGSVPANALPIKVRVLMMNKQKTLAEKVLTINKVE